MIRLVTLFERFPAALLIINGRLEVEHLNQAARDLFRSLGFDCDKNNCRCPEGILDQELRLFYHSGEPETHFCKELASKSGVQSLEVNLFRIQHEVAENDSIVVFLRQIQERTSDDRYYSSLFENSHAIMLLIDPDTGQIADANPAAVRFYGYSREQLKTMKISQINILSPEEIYREMQGAKAGPHHYFHFLHRLASGEIRDVEVYSGEIEALGKRVLFSIIHDITDRIKAEKEIRKLSLAIEQNPCSIVITDREGRIEYVNSTFLQVTGYSLEEVLGQNPRVLKSGDEPSEKYRELWETITAGKTWRGEFHNRKKNGESFWEWASIAPMLDGDGVVTHFIATKEDITERKLAEERHRLEEEMVGNLQRMLAPADQKYPGVCEIMGMSLPAQTVGGDYYDIIRLPDGLMAIAIGDVMGKGIKAALQMTMVRTVLRTLLASITEPRLVVEQVNRFLYPDFKKADSFLTLWLGVLDLNKGRLAYVNAGHYLPLLFGEGKCRPLPGKGPAIGLLAQPRLESHEVGLFPGESVLLYTDGLIEVTDPQGRPFGKEGLSRVVLDHGGKSPQEIIDAVFLAVQDHRGNTEMTDDMTLLLLHMEGAIREP